MWLSSSLKAPGSFFLTSNCNSVYIHKFRVSHVLLHSWHQRRNHVTISCIVVPWRRLPQHPDLGSAQPARARKHLGAHTAVGLGTDLQLRVPHSPQQARWPLIQWPHAVSGVPVHPARLHQRDARPAGPRHLQVSSGGNLFDIIIWSLWDQKYILNAPPVCARAFPNY